MHNYKFTETWFDIAIPGWAAIFGRYPAPTNLLEIGCFEGRATTWLCDNILKDAEVNYTVVDTFGGSLEEAGMVDIKNTLQSNPTYIEDNFRHNISFHPNINFTIHKGFSQAILPTFEQKEVYDFIYIDASHRADDTFVDAYYAFKLLKKGGLLIFDDYLWKDPNRPHPVCSPQLGIEAFMVMYSDQLQQILKGYQVGFVKQ